MEDKDLKTSKITLVVGLAVLLRLCVGLGPFSGRGKAPKYGDFEAQRHWMEVTTNLPILDWYRQTNDNDLTYWGLDYPPLSAYQSWLYGKIIQYFDPLTVALHESRGYEGSKLLMRWSVIFSDAVFIIAALVWIRQLRGACNSTGQIVTLACMLLQPALILIDHGHFQYNNISLGLSLGGAVAIIQGWHVVGSIMYCFAINHKHMALYFAPAFFGHLLGTCMKQRHAWIKVVVLGITVVASFAVVWFPFLQQPENQDYINVLKRLVPLERGVIEDYVANFWCFSKPVMRWKEIFHQEDMLHFCVLSTLVSVIPTMLHQMLRPSPTGLLYSMANSALGFFLFSYQAHEKSILYALLPITMLAAYEPFLAKWMPIIACFSMYPLLERDDLVLQYIATILFYLALPVDPPVEVESGVSQLNPQGSRQFRITFKNLWLGCSFLIMCTLHLARVTVTMEALPYIFDYAFVTYSFLNFLLAFIYLSLKQVLAVSDGRHYRGGRPLSASTSARKRK